MCVCLQCVPNVKTTSIPHFTSRIPGFKHPLFVPFVEKRTAGTWALPVSHGSGAPYLRSGGGADLTGPCQVRDLRVGTSVLAFYKEIFLKVQNDRTAVHQRWDSNLWWKCRVVPHLTVCVDAEVKEATLGRATFTGRAGRVRTHCRASQASWLDLSRRRCYTIPRLPEDTCPVSNVGRRL